MDKQRKQFEEAFKSIFGFDAPEQPAMFSGGSFWMIWQAAIAAAEQAQQAEPVAWQFYQDGKWWNGDDRIKDHRNNTEAAGIPTRDLYATPPAVAVPERSRSAARNGVAAQAT